jgi:glycosyltransferase involved in cell wall biosynthesis
MTVFVNGRFLGQAVTGVQRYGREVLVAIDAALKTGAVPPSLRDERWIVAVPPGTEVDLNFHSLTISTIGRNTGHLWEQWDLQSCARGARLLSLANSGPVLQPRHLVVIHDAGLYRLTGSNSWKYRLAHKAIEAFLFRFARIATVSDFSRRELATVSGIDPDRIAVAPNAGGHLASVAAKDAMDLPAATARRGFFLMVGSRAPHKNIPAALEAYRRLPKSGRPLLVLVGGGNSRIFGEIDLGVDEDVFLAGRVDDAALRSLYQRAQALIFPSLYEGFGIPPLEAMSFGCPVIASDIAPVREVCGDAALYFDPSDIGAIERALALSSQQDPGARQEMVERGFARVASYSWDKTASILLNRLAAL